MRTIIIALILWAIPTQAMVTEVDYVWVEFQSCKELLTPTHMTPANEEYFKDLTEEELIKLLEDFNGFLIF